MALLRTVIYCNLLLFSICFGEGIYNVNQLLDDSLEELAKKITDTGDITVTLDNVRLGDYTLRGAKLADMTSLRRRGDSWMWNDYQTVIINGSLSLGTMFLANAQISGPQNIPDPLITVRFNSIDFRCQIVLDTKASCTATYDFKWTTIDGVTLYSDNPYMNNVDLSLWLKDNLDSLNQQFLPPITRLFEDHIHMCESKRLNHMEMIKYINEVDEWYQN